MELKAAGTPSTDHAFLSVLFAVFACAAALGASTEDEKQEGFIWAGPSEYAGLELFEAAQLLHWMGSTAVTVERCVPPPLDKKGA